MSELLVLLDGRVAGIVKQAEGRLSFRYDEGWRNSSGAYPLSLSMPLAARDHGNTTIAPYLWGLLPDNDIVLSRWAQRFHVSARNPFALLRHVGEDCAGTVQFVRPERTNEIFAGDAPAPQWLTEADVGERLRGLRGDASAGRTLGDNGQFSLAGAQPKTALLYQDGKWGVPSGRTPTTHILKPAMPDLDGHAENEHLCLSVARALGIPAAHTEVKKFGATTAIVATRYDRVNTTAAAALFAARSAEFAAKAAIAATKGDSALTARFAAEVVDVAVNVHNLDSFSKATPIYRVHQEDFCQATATMPDRKYQNQGGPGSEAIIRLLRSNASPGDHRDRKQANQDSGEVGATDKDVSSFTDALIFNWLIGGTDAHAKNYSLLLGGNGMVRLAPLYDVASALGWAKFDPDRISLAMKIGGTYRLRDIGMPEWRKFAAEMRVDEALLIDRIRAMARELPDRLADEILNMRQTGLLHNILNVLGQDLPVRAGQIAGKL